MPVPLPFPQLHHRLHAVHVSLDDMAAEPVAHRERRFDVHGASGDVFPEDTPAERLLEAVECADRALGLDDCLAAPVHGDAVADSEEFLRESRFDHQARAPAPALESADDAY